MNNSISSKKQKHFNDKLDLRNTNEYRELQSMLQLYFVKDINNIIIDYYKTLYIYQLTNDNDHDYLECYYCNCVVIASCTELAKQIHPRGFIYNRNDKKWYCDMYCEIIDEQTFNQCVHIKSYHHDSNAIGICWTKGPCSGSHQSKDGVWTNDPERLWVRKLGTAEICNEDCIKKYGTPENCREHLLEGEVVCAAYTHDD